MFRSHHSRLPNDWTRFAILVALALLLPTLTLSLTSSAVHANVFAVNNLQDLPDVAPGNGVCDVFEAPGVCTLRAAIMEANALDGDDSITLPAGTYTLKRPGTGENNALTGDLDITDIGNTLTITGDGFVNTIIDGGGIDRVFHVLSFTTLELSAVTVNNGNAGADDGGAIFNGGTLTVLDSSVGESAAANGGAIYNRAGASLPLFVPAGVVTLISSTIRVNTATLDGGGIYNLGALTIDGSAILSNGAANDGGGVWNGSTLTLRNDSSVRNNAAGGNGGGLANVGTLATMTADGATVISNDASLWGGGIYSEGELTLANSSVGDNEASASNSAGGGIASLGNSASLTVRNSEVNDNTARAAGGILLSQGVGLVIDSTVARNATVTGDGGGINTTGALSVTNSTISNNRGRTGGGIANPSGPLNVTNSTVTGNTTFVAIGSGANGGGIATSSSEPMVVFHSTITNNSALDGAGVWQAGAGTAFFTSSIIANNDGPDCHGTIGSGGYNLDSDGTCSFAASGDLSGVDPLLSPLADNGGPTQTHALLLGSPAINAGVFLVDLTTDQRGLPRVGTPDIGAFEHQAVDADLDGFADIASGGADCDDTDASVFPGATEVPYDGIDQDCSGSDLTDVDGDGSDADQAVGGTPDCDDTDATVFPGATEIPDDGIDQDCDGTDLTSPAEQLVAEAEFWLTPRVEPRFEQGFDTFVFPGLDGTPIEDLAEVMGPALLAIYRFNGETQVWESFIPGAPTFVNEITVVNHGDALMVAIKAGAELHFSWNDTAEEGLVSTALAAGFTFLGFTGEDDTSLADLLAPLPEAITAAFIFDPVSQEWLAFRRFAPDFVSQVTVVGRLQGMFVLNDGLLQTDITWFNPQPEPPDPGGITIIIAG